MSIDKEEFIDISPAQKETQVFQSRLDAKQSVVPVVRWTPRKTRLERLPFSETTAAMMQAIRRRRVECLHEYFEQTCDWRQQEIAVICGPSQLTYEELDKRANRLAHFLISQGIGEGKQVGILLERSFDTYVALLGVLKVGAAFVPLDPSFSVEQVAFIAQDAGLQMLITTSTLWEKTRALPCSMLEIDQRHELLLVQYETRPSIRVDSASLCYVIYTADASGQLQGVAVSHANIVNFLHVATLVYGVRRNDKIYQGMSIAIDKSFEEIWSAWMAGATLIVGFADDQYFGHRLTKFFIEHKITVLYCMPTLLTIIERDVPSLRLIVVVGEECPLYLVSRWARPGRWMLNTYGPAETTVTATWRELFSGRPPTIGSPLLTYQVYLLDEQFHPVADGERGEICIGGPGVAIGYLNRPALTKEQFIPNPVEQDREAVPRLYRTGDFGRITPAGEIERLGRIDVQVTRLLPIAQANLVSLNGNAPVPSFEASATSGFEVGTSKPGIFSPFA